MASSQQAESNEGGRVKLKHLGFVRVLAVVVSSLYDYAKQNSGPLKSTVGKVENAVTASVGPLYNRFKDVVVPTHILLFLDNKVDEATYKFNECAPPAAKTALLKAQSIVKKTWQLAQDLVEEAKVDGPLAAVSHAGSISKDFAVSQLVVVWYKANKYPAVHGVFEMAIPTATHLSEKYNYLVREMAAKGYSLFNYVPLVPVEDIAKAYKQVEAVQCEKVESGSSSESESEDTE